MYMVTMINRSMLVTMALLVTMPMLLMFRHIQAQPRPLGLNASPCSQSQHKKRRHAGSLRPGC